jgi:hypothetical protein
VTTKVSEKRPVAASAAIDVTGRHVAEGPVALHPPPGRTTDPWSVTVTSSDQTLTIESNAEPVVAPGSTWVSVPLPDAPMVVGEPVRVESPPVADVAVTASVRPESFVTVHVTSNVALVGVATQVATPVTTLSSADAEVANPNRLETRRTNAAAPPITLRFTSHLLLWFVVGVTPTGARTQGECRRPLHKWLVTDVGTRDGEAFKRTMQRESGATRPRRATLVVPARSAPPVNPVGICRWRSRCPAVRRHVMPPRAPAGDRAGVVDPAVPGSSLR